jgi:hypothetical protein
VVCHKTMWLEPPASLELVVSGRGIEKVKRHSELPSCVSYETISIQHVYPVAEESTALIAITKQRLIKTRQTEKT